MKRQNIRKTILIVSFLLLPVTMWYFSPYLIIQGTLERTVAGSFFTFLLLFLFSLGLGRTWCGWVCPTGGFQEILFTAQDKRTKGGRANWTKYFIWVPWLSIIVAGAILAGGYNRVDPFYMTYYGFSIAQIGNYIIYFSVLGLIFGLSMIFGRRSACHYICWMAPFMIIGNRIRWALRLPGLYLRSNKKKCIGCGSCTRICPMSLDVKEMVQKGDMLENECNQCGACVDTCPKGAINFSLGCPDQRGGR